MTSTLAALVGLFLAAFVAATLLPMQSETVLVALQLAGHAPWLLVLVAGTGNVLGSCVNWWLGTQADRFRDRRWFPATPAQLDRARARYAKYGRWTLLLSWLPVVGDPLTLVAGVMREKFAVFLALVALAKFGRYIVLAATVAATTL